MIRMIIAVMTISLISISIACAAATQLPATGQSACSDATGTIVCTGTGQDGDKRKGSTWPTQRFIDNADGTVADALTGLIWIKNANCFNTQTWSVALTSANTLASGACGLTDGSTAGQWRIPNRKELRSLIDYSKSGPSLPTGNPFTSVQNSTYWTSTSSDSETAWFVSLSDGNVNYEYHNEGISRYVWPVRGGQ